MTTNVRDIMNQFKNEGGFFRLFNEEEIDQTSSYFKISEYSAGSVPSKPGEPLDLMGIVISGEERLAKPDEKIYLLLLERYGLEAAECLFIDDNARNIRAAKTLGFHAIYLHNDVCLKEELTSLGIRV